jgi:cell wall-associated NlpC family hydrolase
VNYSYRKAGLNLGHGTVYLRQYSRRISTSDLRRGDLVFFDQLGKRASHVGIYIGNGKFVHAPSTGKRVQTAELHSPYWKKHLNDVRRLDVY